MRIETIPIEQIKAAPYNPRRDLQPGDAEYEKLQRSLSEFDCVEPLSGTVARATWSAAISG